MNEAGYLKRLLFRELVGVPSTCPSEKKITSDDSIIAIHILNIAFGVLGWGF